MSHSKALLSALSLLAVLACAPTTATPQAPVTAGAATVRFSNDYSSATVEYETGRWVFYRPVVPSMDYEAKGTVFWVAPGGDDDSKGTAEKPFRTIGKGCSMAGPGDIVYIRSGNYTENLVIRKSGVEGRPIIISAAPGEVGRVKISPSADFVRNNLHGAVVEVTGGAKHVWINGLIIEGYRGRPGAPANEDYGANGITWSDGAGYGCRATNNIVCNNLHCGLKEMGHGGTGIRIEGNLVFENGNDALDHGIYATADDMQIIGNIVLSNTGYGIHSYSSPRRQQITHNILVKNGWAGILLAGSESQVYHNVAVFNRGGIFYFRSGCAYNVVKNNIFAFNDEFDGGYDNGGGTLGDPHDNVDDSNNYFPKSPYPKIGATRSVLSDPLFIDAQLGDYRLSAESPCIDRGEYVGLPFTGVGPDLGAIESNHVRSSVDPRLAQPLAALDFRTVLARLLSRGSAVNPSLRRSRTVWLSATRDLNPPSISTLEK